MTRNTFDLDRFIADCRDALSEHSPQKAVREVVAGALADAPSMMKALSEPKRPGINKLHESADLTILNIVWPPGFTIMPHDHRMWAVIGIYNGREDNIFWRRIKDGDNGRIEAAGAHALMQGDCWPLGPDIIHSVTNPIPRFTSAVQIYGGNFFNMPRSQWDPETLREERYDSARTIRLFETGNGRPTE